MLLGTRSFHGNVYATDLKLNGVEPPHFQRWLALFEQTASQLLEPEPAGKFIVMARRATAGLQRGFFGEASVPN